jgi:hypothetical protein
VLAIDDVVWVSWKFTAEELLPSLRHTNDVIGAYVTAGASIHLYRYLNRLQKMQFIAIQSLLYLFSRERNPIWLKLCTNWEKFLPN